MPEDITKHEGSKYLKRIISPVALEPGKRAAIQVDVYAVLEAFGVTCPAIAHCIKKLLMPGQRGKGDKLADLKGAMAALNRAIDLEQDRTTTTVVEPMVRRDPLKASAQAQDVLDRIRKDGEERVQQMAMDKMTQEIKDEEDRKILDDIPKIPLEEIDEKSRAIQDETARKLEAIDKARMEEPASLADTAEYPAPPEYPE